MTMKYKIERSVANAGDTWVRSSSYPGTYTLQQAKEIREYARRDTFMKYRVVPVQAKRYIVVIEGPHGWCRSGLFRGEYTLEQAQSIVADNEYGITSYRYTEVVPGRVPVVPVVPVVHAVPQEQEPVPVKPFKPYRRHAAVTPLELRGAITMLESARKHVSYATMNTRAALNTMFDAYSTLTTARMQCVRELEALEQE